MIEVVLIMLMLYGVCDYYINILLVVDDINYLLFMFF